MPGLELGAPGKPTFQILVKRAKIVLNWAFCSIETSCLAEAVWTQPGPAAAFPAFHSFRR